LPFLIPVIVEPGEASSLAAQVAVTLAGFAGVVVVFRPASVHQWSSLDRFRLRLLLNNSILPLAYSVFAIFLLTIKPPPESIWRWCSGVAVGCQVPFAIMNFTEARHLAPAEFKGINKMLFFPLFAIGTITILLQVYNMAVLNWFWPFFAAIVVHLIAAMLQFMRLVLLPRRNQPAA
jgi:hypothetical protein